MKKSGLRVFVRSQVLLIAVAPDRWTRPDARVGVIAVTGLAGLMVMNAAFGAWWGGSTVGPRYLSPVLLVFAAWAALILGGEGPLWSFFLQQLSRNGPLALTHFRVALTAIAVAIGVGYMLTREPRRAA